jgi:hypothetical protein
MQRVGQELASVQGEYHATQGIIVGPPDLVNYVLTLVIHQDDAILVCIYAVGGDVFAVGRHGH